MNPHATAAPPLCYHCGAPCEEACLREGEKSFCCEGCKLVHDLLQEHQLCTYYQLTEKPGKRPEAPDRQYRELDLPAIAGRYISYRSDRQAIASFFLPQAHCASCIWLLERLHQLMPGIYSSRLSLLERRLSITYNPKQVALSGIASLLARLGYPPDLPHDDNELQGQRRQNRRLITQIGVAGFCFGNIMMLSFPDYLVGSDPVEPSLQQFFGWLSLALALPVFFYSAVNYFKNTWQAAQARYFSIDMPIALGLTAMMLRSGYEIVTATGTGYLDSLAGLVFFLLIGRYAQARTYQALTFDRKYTSFLPLAVLRIKEEGEVITPIADLRPGDVLWLRNGELIVAEAELLSSVAQVDYSFITGEELPVVARKGDLLHAGGRIVGDAVRIRLRQSVQPGHLADLWNHRRGRDQAVSLSRLADRLAKYFTVVVLAIALLTFLYWMLAGNTGKAVLSMTSVLIIACPCALAITVPFTLGNMMRRAARQQIYLRQSLVLEDVAAADTLVFDKTGTLTQAMAARVSWQGRQLTAQQWQAVRSVALQSLHPLSRAVVAALPPQPLLPVSAFSEQAGLGLTAEAGGYRVQLGSAAFTGAVAEGLQVPEAEGSQVYVRIDDELMGFFLIRKNVREGVEAVIRSLSRRLRLYLLSGDAPQDRSWLQSWFRQDDSMHFHMLPEQKAAFIREQQRQGHDVIMVGDGLNDAAALQASRVGIAVADNLHQFTPGCDVLVHASALKHLPAFIELSHAARRIILYTFLFSLVYNVAGMLLAVQGALSPLAAAVLMPISSLSVMSLSAVACWMVSRRKGW
ncbi:MAG: heavy metal translocating P-type ATPase metal-binding domain-containing protein [Chitinophagales bacterium]|nr:heavy metal translocating P-type ATPase metal-binding domain-containing protein [Chitinophagales bacterium]MDW8394447.1 heavy metal translocating P-type ATPase metal-binding domain-containing protein [Chitinophagales bacterium]